MIVRLSIPCPIPGDTDIAGTHLIVTGKTNDMGSYNMTTITKIASGDKIGFLVAAADSVNLLSTVPSTLFSTDNKSLMSVCLVVEQII